MRTTEEIILLYRTLVKEMDPIRLKMVEIRDAVNGDVVVPLPELDVNEKASVVNLISVGLDQSATRISSTVPDVYFPPQKPGVTLSEKQARQRRLAVLAWWQMNKMNLKLRKRARYLLGYASSPVVIRPDFKREIPTWHVRDPLTAYLPATEDSMTPDYGIFSYPRPLSWLMQRYPMAMRLLNKRNNPRPQDLFTIVEYNDAEQWTLIVLGKSEEFSLYENKGTQQEVLDTTINRAGVCWIVSPKRICLDRQQGQYDGMLGLYFQMAQLQALETIAVHKGVMPATYLVSNPGEVAEFIEGPYDGRTGYINRVKGGKVEQVQTNPGFMTNPTLDRYERYQRIMGGVPAEYGGESASNIRTGRRGESVLSATIDFPIQEAQEIFSQSLEEENRRAIAVMKSYFDRPRSFYVSWNNKDMGNVNYEPSKAFVTDEHVVKFSHAGADINSLAIAGGQRVSLGTLSRKSFMLLDPLVEDADREHEQVIYEALEQATLQSLQAQVQNPSAPMDTPDIARIGQLVVTDKENLFDAIMTVHNEAQARQAAPNPAGSPAAQPGLIGQGQPPPGLEQGPAPQPGPAGLADLLGQLNRPQRTLGGLPQGPGANQQGALPTEQAVR